MVTSEETNQLLHFNSTTLKVVECPVEKDYSPEVQAVWSKKGATTISPTQLGVRLGSMAIFAYKDLVMVAQQGNGSELDASAPPSSSDDKRSTQTQRFSKLCLRVLYVQYLKKLGNG